LTSLVGSYLPFFRLLTEVKKTPNISANADCDSSNIALNLIIVAGYSTLIDHSSLQFIKHYRKL
jgi:hypothetical protein